jgi:hypothetical protein
MTAFSSVRSLINRKDEEGQVKNNFGRIIPFSIYYYTISLCCGVIPAKLMRFQRVKADGHGFYHCVSRVVEGRFIFQTSPDGSPEAEHFISSCAA